MRSYNYRDVLIRWLAVFRDASAMIVVHQFEDRTSDDDSEYVQCAGSSVLRRRWNPKTRFHVFEMNPSRRQGSNGSG